LLISDPPRRSYNRWLAVLVALFLATTVIFTILFAVEKNKVATTATTPSTTMTMTTTTTTPAGPTTTTSAGIVIDLFV
jgi:hypothetical protein